MNILAWVIMALCAFEVVASPFAVGKAHTHTPAYTMVQGILNIAIVVLCLSYLFK